MKQHNFKKIIAVHYKAAAFLIVILILILGWFFLLKDKWQDIRKKQTTTLKNTESELAVTENSYIKFKKEASASDILLQQRLTKLKGILPDKKDLPLLYLQMLQTMKNLDLAVISLDIAEDGVDLQIPNAQLQVKEVELKVGLSEPLDYIALKKLLAKLYQQTPILNIKAIDLSGSSSSKKTTKSFGSNNQQSSGPYLTFYTYYIDQSPLQGAGDPSQEFDSALMLELMPPMP